MKKLLLLSIVCLMTLFVKAQNQDYVDLGLPSGTLWKVSNESILYGRDAAVQKFGNKLPSSSQIAELSSHCTWTWMGSGYKVTGPNGRFIVLPAMGWGNCENNDVEQYGNVGEYWVFSPYDGMSDFSFDELDNGTLEGVMEEDNPDMYYCKKYSVRLVKSK